MNLNLLLALLIFVTLAVTYIFWLRPLLKATPSLGYLYQDEERFWRAVARKFDGLKQKLVTIFVFVASFVVSAYDFLAPYVATAGMNADQLTDKVPSWAWPLIGMALVILVDQLRKIGERSLLTKIATGEAVVTLEHPQVLNPAAPPSPPVPVVTPVAPEDAIPMAELLAESSR